MAATCAITHLSETPDVLKEFNRRLKSAGVNETTTTGKDIAQTMLDEYQADRIALIAKINSTPEGRDAFKEFNNPTPKPEPGALDFGNKSPDKTSSV